MQEERRGPHPGKVRKGHLCPQEKKKKKKNTGESEVKGREKKKKGSATVGGERKRNESPPQMERIGGLRPPGEGIRGSALHAERGGDSGFASHWGEGDRGPTPHKEEGVGGSRPAGRGVKGFAPGEEMRVERPSPKGRRHAGGSAPDGDSSSRPPRPEPQAGAPNKSLPRAGLPRTLPDRKSSHAATAQPQPL